MDESELRNLLESFADQVRYRMSTALIAGKPVLHVYDECVEKEINLRVLMVGN